MASGLDMLVQTIYKVTSGEVCLFPPLPPSPSLQQGSRVRRRQRLAAERQLATEAIEKAEEAKMEKVKTEEVDTIEEKAADVL